MVGITYLIGLVLVLLVTAVLSGSVDTGTGWVAFMWPGFAVYFAWTALIWVLRRLLGVREPWRPLEIFEGT